MKLSPQELEHLAATVNEPMNPVKFLAIDPGKSNGVTFYDERYRLVFSMTVDADDMVEFLEQFKLVHTVICESFLLYPNKAKEQTYSSMETSRVIGRIESWCAQMGIRLIMQPASIKPIAYKWLGKKKPSKSDSTNHQKDAHAHFIYWGVRTGKIDMKSLI